jgi:nitrate/nitrite-specific signal transduction histidine kinase
MSEPVLRDPAALERVVATLLRTGGDYDLPSLLTHILAEARALTTARYGAISVLNDDGTALSELVTVGLSPDEEMRIGYSPTGNGLLGTLVTAPGPVRLARLAEHPKSTAFPAHHPRMTSFLGVPIALRNINYGSLYLTDKVGTAEFTEDDEDVVSALAVVAGLALENDRIHRRIALLSTANEREVLSQRQRDGAIRRIHDAKLTLHSIPVTAAADDIMAHLRDVIAEVDDAIRVLQSANFDLGLFGSAPSVRSRVLSLLTDMRLVVGFEINASFDGPVDSTLTDHLAEHVLATLREWVINIWQHAHATRAEVLLSVDGDHCRLRVLDNGSVPDDAASDGERPGIDMLRRRAEKLQGGLLLKELEAGGTILTWEVPLDQ